MSDAQDTGKVTVYTTPWCGFCKMAKDYLSSVNVPFKEVNVELDIDAAMLIMQKTGSAGVPVIRIFDDYILGFDRQRIDTSLRANKLLA